MTTPQTPEKNITADQGFARLVDVMARWIPARLHHTAQIRKAIRASTGRKGQ